MDHKTKNIIIVSGVITLIISLLIFLYYFSPEEIVSKIGVNNSYLILFFISFFGGFSAFGAFSFFATIITFVTGGLNPLYVGLIAGASLATGDLIMFFLGIKGREAIKGKLKVRLDKLSKKVTTKTEKFIPFIIFIYIGLVPLPNDILILFLAMIKYKPKKVIIPLILGDFAFTLLLSFLSFKGISLF